MGRRRVPVPPLDLQALKRRPRPRCRSCNGTGQVLIQQSPGRGHATPAPATYALCLACSSISTPRRWPA